MRWMCMNETMPSTNTEYGFPDPVVDLYIAAASMVCFLLISYDVWDACRCKKYWFPCRFFSINSVTLTLIPIAAKISVESTTPRPSKQDQLSKLFGTVFVCVTMCFMLPSIAKNTEFESYANVIALSIFVITVLVNVCVQMATGLVFNFIPEHIIILMFMLFLLMRFWLLVTSINVYKNDHVDVSKDLMSNNIQRNMLTRLEYCYIYGYHSSPQLSASKHASMGDVHAVCMMCLIVLVQAVIRAFLSEDLRFCGRTSDYRWSMWAVVGSQGLTLALVSIAVGSRWLIVITHFTDVFEEKKHINSNEAYLPFQSLLSLRKLPSAVEKSFRIVIFHPLFIATFFIMLFGFIVHSILAVMCLRLLHWLGIPPSGDMRGEFIDLLRSHDVTVVNWALQKAVVDMQGWVEKQENVILKHLKNLLSNVAPSQESAFKVGLDGEGIQISSLSMVLLVEISKRVNTKKRIHLPDVLDEVFEIILFIDNRLYTGSSNKDRMRSTLAKVMHKYGLRSGTDEIVLEQKLDREQGKVNFSVKRKPTCQFFDEDGPVEHCIHDTTRQVSDIINYQPNESPEDVYGRIEQVFSDMLQAFLAKLPLAVYNYILESPVEEYEDKARLGLGYMCNIRSVQTHLRFSLPCGSNITSLFDTDTPSTPTQAHGVSTPSPSRAPAVEMVSQIQEVAQATLEEV